jgi:hypothetical protein
MSTSEMPNTSVDSRPAGSFGRASGGAWAGWRVFAAVVAITMGVYEAIEGLVAIFNDEYYLVGSNGLVISVDYTVWGWVHLVLGLIAVAAGIGLLQRRGWARVAVVILACLSAVVNFGFLSAYPWWSTLVIAFDVIVIYALTVHWHEAKA